MRISGDAKEMLEMALQRYGRLHNVNIYDEVSIFDREEQPAKYNVNWGAMGNQTPEKAKEYAAEILLAAEIAETLNRLEIIEDRNAELDISREEYYKAVEGMAGAFGRGDAWVAEVTIKRIEAKHRRKA